MRWRNVPDFLAGCWFTLIFMLMNPVTASVVFFAVVIGGALGSFLSVSLLATISVILLNYSLFKLISHPKRVWDPPINLGLALLLELIFFAAAWFVALVKLYG